MRHSAALPVVLVALLTLALPPVRAWDYEGHRMINEVALELLPTNSPAFILTPDNRERIAFLGGELDRWRNTPHYPLRHANHPDHYLDVEDLEPLGLTVTNLPPYRYDFVAHLARIRAQHPDRFPPSPTNDLEHTRTLPGFLPWTIAEQFARLKSAFSYLKAYAELGSPSEITNAQANVVYLMGVMGHAVGDATQPLHSTRHYNGWVGPNPEGFATNRTFHSWIDGGYLRRAGITLADVRPHTRPARVLASVPPGTGDDPIFQFACDLVGEQFRQVIPLYRMERAGQFNLNGPRGLEGRPFLANQLATAAVDLADLWFTAWEQAPADPYLRSQLSGRKPAAP